MSTPAETRDRRASPDPPACPTRPESPASRPRCAVARRPVAAPCAATIESAARIDSPFLLPKGGRCLTKSATTVADQGGHDGTEGEHRNASGFAAGGAGAVSRKPEGRKTTYHAPETPYARLLVSAAVTDGMKDRLRAVAIQLDPLRLLEEIRSVQHHLAALAAGQTTHMPRAEGNLDAFLVGLATAWQHGEVRATHRRTPRTARDWRTRTDPFESAWPCIRAWLEAEPDRIGRELFVRLQRELPGVFPDGQLRTFQRRVREWRHTAARQLVFASPSEDAA